MYTSFIGARADVVGTIGRSRSICRDMGDVGDMKSCGRELIISLLFATFNFSAFGYHSTDPNSIVMRFPASPLIEPGAYF